LVSVLRTYFIAETKVANPSALNTKTLALKMKLEEILDTGSTHEEGCCTHFILLSCRRFRNAAELPPPEDSFGLPVSSQTRSIRLPIDSARWVLLTIMRIALQNVQTLAPP
jgi:hypothetical protein